MITSDEDEDLPAPKKKILSKKAPMKSDFFAPKKSKETATSKTKGKATLKGIDKEVEELKDNERIVDEGDEEDLSEAEGVIASKT